VQAFVNAIQRAINWANGKTPDEIARLLMTYPGFSGMEAAVLSGSLRRSVSAQPRTALITRDAFDNAVKFPVAVGVLDQPMPYERIVSSAFAQRAAEQFPPGK